MDDPERGLHVRARLRSKSTTNNRDQVHLGSFYHLHEVLEHKKSEKRVGGRQYLAGLEVI